MASVNNCLACRRMLAPSLFCVFCGTFVLDPQGTTVMASRLSRLGASIVNSLLVFITLGIGWVIWWFIVAPNGQNPGKAVVGLRVIRTDGKAARTWRMLGRGLLGGLLPLPLLFDNLWLLWDRDAQTLHDKLFATVVVQARGSQHIVAGRAAMPERWEVRASTPQEAPVTPPGDEPVPPPFASPLTPPRGARGQLTQQPDSPGSASVPATAAQELVHLMELRDRGLITEQEYQDRRKTVVDQT